MCVPSRNRLFDAIKSAAALSLIPLPLRAALRWKGLHFRNHPTAEFAKPWLFYECQRFCCTWCSTQESGGSSACNREACCKKAVLGFPAEPCKADTTGTPPDEPKSRKMHQCELVGSKHVSPPNPRIKSQNPKGGFGALWHAFLQYLSSCNERYCPRRAYRKENAGKNAKPPARFSYLFYILYYLLLPRRSPDEQSGLKIRITPNPASQNPKRTISILQHILQ